METQEKVHNPSKLEQFWGTVGTDMLTVLVFKFDLDPGSGLPWAISKLTIDSVGNQLISTTRCGSERTRDGLYQQADAERITALKALLGINKHSITDSKISSYTFCAQTAKVAEQPDSQVSLILEHVHDALEKLVAIKATGKVYDQIVPINVSLLKALGRYKEESEVIA